MTTTVQPFSPMSPNVAANTPDASPVGRPSFGKAHIESAERMIDHHVFHVRALSCACILPAVAAILATLGSWGTSLVAAVSILVTALVQLCTLNGRTGRASCTSYKCHFYVSLMNLFFCVVAICLSAYVIHWHDRRRAAGRCQEDGSQLTFECLFRVFAIMAIVACGLLLLLCIAISVELKRIHNIWLLADQQSEVAAAGSDMAVVVQPIPSGLCIEATP